MEPPELAIDRPPNYEFTPEIFVTTFRERGSDSALPQCVFLHYGDLVKLYRRHGMLRTAEVMDNGLDRLQALLSDRKMLRNEADK